MASVWPLYKNSIVTCHWVGCLPERFAQVSCILSLMLETVHFLFLINPHFFSYHVFSPCYVDKDSDLEMAAKRITWGKFANAGQVWCDHMNIGKLPFYKGPSSCL